MQIKFLTTYPSSRSAVNKESLELANDLCDYIGFAEDEARHFLLLVDFARAGSTRLKTRLRNQVIESQSRAQTLTKRLKVDEAMTVA